VLVLVGAWIYAALNTLMHVEHFDAANIDAERDGVVALTTEHVEAECVPSVQSIHPLEIPQQRIVLYAPVLHAHELLASY
jgi:hypothetical protein